MSAVMTGGISSATLHLIAMGAMLLDHIWAVGLVSSDVFTCIGRIAFPIFAFLLAEGFRRTKNRKRYAMRLFLFALISEVPFNLMVSGSVFFPFHQNIYWTLLIGYGAMALNEKAARTGKGVFRVVTAVLTIICSYVLGFVLFVDYYGVGVAMILAFYFFNEDDFLHHLGQFAALYYLNIEVLGGLEYALEFFGLEIMIPQQGLALLALPIIWLYQGRQGYHSRAFQYFRYAFYPAHILILYLIAAFL